MSTVSFILIAASLGFIGYAEYQVFFGGRPQLDLAEVAVAGVFAILALATRE